MIYPAARAFVLEAQAFLSDTDGLVSELQTHRPNDITPSFLAYLMQLSIRQSDDPDATVAAFNELGKNWSPEEPHTTRDPFYAPFNRYSCRIAKELAIALQGLEDQQAYMEQDGNEQSELPDDDLDMHTRRLLYACTVDTALLDDLLKATADERFVPIVKRLLNVPYRQRSLTSRKACALSGNLEPSANSSRTSQRTCKVSSTRRKIPSGT